jgi:copper homeostasis protein
VLQVAVVHPGDAAGAQAGGADRLVVVGVGPREGRTPELAVVRELLAATDLPVRVVLRLRDDDSTTGGELARFVGLAEELRADGVEGFVFAFLTPSLDLDVPVLATLGERLEAPWTLGRGVDHTLDRSRTFAALRGLPGLDMVLTAGSARGVEHGLDDLCRRAADDAALAELLVAGGGLRPEDVPWLVRSGIRRLHVGRSVRPGRSTKAWTDAGLVRSWRLLLDDAAAAADAARP